MKTIKIILLLMLISFGLNTIAQVAINNDGSAADSSAMLDVKSTTGGLLLPRLTNVERDAISSPVDGLIIFNTDEGFLQVYFGTSWKFFPQYSCVPQRPTSVTGNGYPDCNQTGVTYSTAEVQWASSYHWTVPSDASIASGQGTTSITVDFGTASGNVSVRAESGCGNSNYRDLPITIGVPAQPGSITGNTHPDCSATETYSINAVNGALNYNWTVPSDATITSGQGTINITVNFGTSSGIISVCTSNSCGNSDYTDLVVTIGIPAQPDSIYGSPGVPANSTRTYSTDTVIGAPTYHWTVPTDATITSGQGTTNITINFGVSSGNVKVRTENSCGESNYKTFEVTIRDFLCGDQYEDLRDNHIYNTVSIGNQCWFVENLNIGTRIDDPNNQTNNDTIEKYCYNNDTANCTTYGGLYQWNEMMQYATTEGVRGVCPPGWHLPTDNEWKTLEMALGMSQSQADATGWRGTDQGEQMKSTSGWYNNGNGTNSSGFNALPGGYRPSNGSFYNLGNNGTWWSSTEGSGTNAWMRYLYYDSDRVSRYYNYKTGGRSVRCLKD